MDTITRKFRWAVIKMGSQDVPHWEPIMESVHNYPGEESSKYFDVAGSDEGLRPSEILKFGEYLEPPKESV